MSVDFEYLNLAEVNPEIPPVPPGEYNFRVVGAERNTFTYKKDNPERGIEAGQEASYVRLNLSIVDDPEQSGRRVSVSVFPGPQGARGLRLVQDATGVAQEGTLDEWLNALVVARATFAALLSNGVDKSGKPTNDVRLTTAKPVA